MGVNKKNDYWMRTKKIGDNGEKFIHRILEWKGYNIIQKWSKDSKWDCKAELDDLIKTFEGKTQPNFADYGGFSVEVANKWVGNYISQTPNFTIDGIKCVKTGLAVSKADYQVFTDGKHVAFFIPTEVLKVWFDDVITHKPHRVRWGGYKGRALQAQITIEDIFEISKWTITNFKGKGKKSKTQLALEKKGLYIGGK